jgi:hypothetical protein
MTQSHPDESALIGKTQPGDCFHGKETPRPSEDAFPGQMTLYLLRGVALQRESEGRYATLHRRSAEQPNALDPRRSGQQSASQRFFISDACLEGCDDPFPTGDRPACHGASQPLEILNHSEHAGLRFE